MTPLVSIIVPVLRDADEAARLVGTLDRDPAVEVVLADGGEDPALLALETPDRVRLVRAAPGRARQMNAGAAAAGGSWLLFLHADSTLPPGWLDRFRALPDEVAGGWFEFALDDPAWQARVIERGVRWRVARLRLPYGDQGLFVRRSLFERLGGYRDQPLLEDVEFVRRLVGAGPVAEIPLPLLTSARRWRQNGWLRRSARNLSIVVAYFAGVPPTQLARWDTGRSPREIEERRGTLLPQSLLPPPPRDLPPMRPHALPRALSLSVHELRTPVTVVAGYLRMLLREQGGPLTDKQRKMLEEAERSCVRVETLINQMSDLGKLESGDLALAQKEVDMTALVAEVARGEYGGQERGVRVEARVAERPAVVIGDRPRLEAALRSLLQAAVRERGDPCTIVIACTVQPDGTPPSVVVAIDDEAAVDRPVPAQNPGFDEWRGGLGLALPVAQRVIERLGGTLRATRDDRPRAGAVLQLPLSSKAGPT